LIQTFNDQGITTTHISTYTEGKWLVYTRRIADNGEEVIFGDDFTILPGKAYFVKVEEKATATLSGQTFAESVPVNMSNGWNLISIQGVDLGYTAASLIDKINAQKIVADSVAKYDSGLYSILVKDQGQFFGNDFNIIYKSGYFVKVTEGGGNRFTP